MQVGNLQANMVMHKVDAVVPLQPARMHWRKWRLTQYLHTHT